MYIPKEFMVSDQQEVLSFLEQNALGIVIVSSGLADPLASHIPFTAKAEAGEIVLEGHISRANEQAEHLRKGKTVLVIFQGPNAYISSSVYTHTNVPTWNYQAVHVYGTVEPMETPELVKHLTESVSHFESHRHSRLSFEDFPPGMIEDYLKGICGIRIRAYKTEAAYKMSQNRNAEDYGNIVSDLSGSSSAKDNKTGLAMKAISNHKKR